MVLNSPTFYLSIDCGGTKTSAVFCNASGDIVARALSSGSNYAYLGQEAFLAVIKQVTATCLVIALQSPSPISLPVNHSTHVDAAGIAALPFSIGAAWLGVSGVDSQAAVDRLVPLVAALLSLPAARLTISNDTHLLAAPLRMFPDVSSAVAAVAGTGSIVASFREGHPLQELARTGGWGWILGDEGGGFDVGRTAVRALLIQCDAESAGAAPRPGTLSARVLKQFGVGDVLDLLVAIHLPDVPGEDPREKRLSSLSPLVFDAAFQDGDPIALEVLQECAHKLAAQIAFVLLPASATEPHAKRVRAAESVLCLGGSLWGVERYRDMVIAALAEQQHVFRRVEFVHDAAAVGAKALVATYEGEGQSQ